MVPKGERAAETPPRGVGMNEEGAKIANTA
jgi:hypothetical protein